MKKNIRKISFCLIMLCMLNDCAKKAPEQKVYHIGILCGLDYIASIPDSFKAGMTELGYVEGKTIFYDLQRTNFEPEKEEKILKQFVKDKVDLIFTFPTEVSMAAKKIAQGTKIPVLFTFANIEDTNLVDSIRRPGGNITGVRYPGPDLAVKRFEILRELMPQIKRVWIPYQKGYPIVESQLKVLRPIAEASGVTLIECPASNAADIRADLQARADSGNIGIDAMLIIVEPLGVTDDAFEVFGKFAAEHKIPVGGALMSVNGCESVFGVNVNLDNIGRQSAVLADKIFKGTPAGSIPVISAESFFQFNYKEAQKEGLNVPEGLLGKANEIIR